MGGDTVRIRPGTIEWRELEGEIVALDLRTSTYLAMNRTGAAVWPLLVEGASQARLAEKIVDEFTVSAETAEADVTTFLEELREQDLLES